MLTGYQVSTGGYMTEYGDLLCESCFDFGDDYCRPVSNYELDEWQSGDSDYYSGEDGHADDCYCSPSVDCAHCGNEMREMYVSPDCQELQDEEEDA